MYRAFPGSQRNIFNKEWEGRRRVKSPFRPSPLEKKKVLEQQFSQQRPPIFLLDTVGMNITRIEERQIKNLFQA
jgi:hypothetical protein